MKKKKSSEKEFIRLVNQSQGILHKVCRMYCDNEEHRKDLFQEIVIQLWKSFPSFRGDARFSSWMYRVALNVAIQDLRKEKKRRLFLFETYEFKEVEVSFPFEENEQIKLLYQAISKLDKVEKAIIMLHLDEVPNEEIANIIGITPNYVRVKMSRIRKKLADKINSR